MAMTPHPIPAGYARPTYRATNLRARGKRAPIMLVRAGVFAGAMGLATLAGLFSDNVPTGTLILPVVLIAAMLSVPLAEWLLGRLNTLDPIALMCLFGLHFFIYGPIYQISLDYWPFIPWNQAASGFIPKWYWLNTLFLGISLLTVWLYRPAAAASGAQVVPPPIRSTNALRQRLLMVVLFTLGMKILTFAIFGGVSGVIAAYQDRLDGGGVSDANTFGGIGPIVALGNAFPIACGYLAIHLQSRRGRNRSIAVFLGYTAVISVMAFAANGLMGSRAYIIYALLMALGLYHFRIRTLRKRDIFISIVALFSFSQAYYAVKFGGISALFNGSSTSSVLKARQIDDLGDFGLIRDYTRMDVQTFSIYSIDRGYVDRSWGRSYAGGVAAIIPQAIWPNRIDSFTQEKSQIMYSSRAPTRRSNLVFGGFGEAYVNFGILAVILAVPFGMILSFMRRIVNEGMLDEVKAQYATVCALFPIMLLVYDSNSLLYIAVTIMVTPIGFGFFLTSARNRTKASHKYRI